MDLAKVWSHKAGVGDVQRNVGVHQVRGVFVAVDGRQEALVALVAVARVAVPLHARSLGRVQDVQKVNAQLLAPVSSLLRLDEAL